MIRLPFVSRRAYDDAQAAIEFERKRSEGLLEILLRMKSEGAVLLPAAPPRLEPRELTVWEKALEQHPRARNDRRLHAHLSRWAEDELAKGRSADEIADEITAWSDVRHEDDDDDDEDALEL